MELHDIHRIGILAPFASGTTNSYFVERPVPTLIDVPANEPPYYEQLEAGLRKRGYSVSKDVERIVVTHPHFDHSGLAAQIVNETGAEVWTYGGGAHYLESFPDEFMEDFRYYKALLDEAGVPGWKTEYLEEFQQTLSRLGSRIKVSRCLEDGDEIELGSAGFRVVHVPGHTPWCFMLYDAARQVAFTGDFLIRDISSNAIIQRPRESAKEYRSLKSYIESLKKTRDLGLELAFPGHGSIIRNVHERIGDILSSIEDRRNRILSFIKTRRACTPFEIVNDFFPDIPDWQVLLGISEVIGHLELLEEAGLVRREAGPPLMFSM